MSKSARSSRAAIWVVGSWLLMAVQGVASPEPLRTSSGCGTEPIASPGSSSVVKIEIDGLDREFRLHTPAGYDPEKPMPLVLVIHGYTGTAERTETEYTSFSQHADSHGYVVAYPQATGFAVGEHFITSWNDLACNVSPGPEGSNCTAEAFDYPTPPECGESRECDWCSCNDDVGYIEAVLDEIETSLCVDLSRVYATGISNGGMFVQRLGCDLAQRFAAVAPVAGTLAKGSHCAPPASPKISLLNIYGTQDRTVPFDGTPASDGFLYSASSKVTAAWAAETSQNCEMEESSYSTSRDGVTGLKCRQRANCQTGAQVVDCGWDGGHDWPRKEKDQFGIDVIWEFFENNAR
jgi:polyhydroxybutyrate depolymerase